MKGVGGVNRKVLDFITKFIKYIIFIIRSLKICIKSFLLFWGVWRTEKLS